MHYRLVVREYEAARYGQQPPIELGPIIHEMQDGMERLALAQSVQRLQDGSTDAIDIVSAEMWRPLAQSSLEEYSSVFAERGIEIPKANSVESAVRIADELLNGEQSAAIWAPTFLQHQGSEQFFRNVESVPPSVQGLALAAWAPYTHHCLRVTLVGINCWREKLIRQSPNNDPDIQYLFYLPFCTVFCSEDTLHRRLVPHMMRPNQRFCQSFGASSKRSFAAYARIAV